MRILNLRRDYSRAHQRGFSDAMRQYELDNGSVMDQFTHQNTPVILVACCGPKLKDRASAAELYVSSLFKKSCTYVEQRGQWFILSARHGLLAPAAVIAPYGVTLKKMLAAKKREWGQRVKDQIEHAGLAGKHLVALAGADYVKPILTAGLSVEQPITGLIIGKQLQWLNKENG